MEEEKRRLEEETEVSEEPKPEAEPEEVSEEAPEAPVEEEVSEVSEEAATPAADDASPEPVAEEPKPERTFTQEQVNALVGKARAEGRASGLRDARKEALDRYGVDDDDALDALFANGSRYDELSARFAERDNSLKEARTELALVKSGVLPERQADVKAILTAQGMEITEENIESMLPTHPEWKGSVTPEPAPQAASIPQPKPMAEPVGGEGGGEAEPTPDEGVRSLGPKPKNALADAGEGDEARKKNDVLRDVFGIK